MGYQNEILNYFFNLVIQFSLFLFLDLIQYLINFSILKFIKINLKFVNFLIKIHLLILNIDINLSKLEIKVNQLNSDQHSN